MLSRPSKFEIHRKVRRALHQAGFEAFATLTPKFCDPEVEKLVTKLVELQELQWDAVGAK